MAFVKPKINTIKPDIKNVSIYLRSVKKFGKSTLFRDVIVEKYGDPSYGLLVEVGMERGANLLDNVNTTHVDTYKDLVELKKWLIEENGKEHHIKIVCYDVADEIVPLFDNETIRRHNVDNPQKQVKSIKAAMGGYAAGEQFSATLMKNYFDQIRSAGIQVWVLSHSKYKNIKDKANVDNEGYMQLTSNLSAAYEAALGDISDVVLTGIIDRNIETVGDGDNAKRYATDAIRKLYFRGTPEIDAGGRFVAETVPEYMVFDKPNMAADFIKIVEEGMEKSKTDFRFTSRVKLTEEPTPNPLYVKENFVEPEDDEPPFDVDDIDDLDETIETEVDFVALRTEIRNKNKAGTKEQKTAVKAILNATGKKLDELEDIEALTKMLEVFQ